MPSKEQTHGLTHGVTFLLLLTLVVGRSPFEMVVEAEADGLTDLLILVVGRSPFEMVVEAEADRLTDLLILVVGRSPLEMVVEAEAAPTGEDTKGRKGSS